METPRHQCLNNFLYRVEQPGKIGFVGLFNGADELNLDEAWMGMNDAGFVILNTCGIQSACQRARLDRPAKAS